MELGGIKIRRAKVGGRGGTGRKRKRERTHEHRQQCGDCGKGGWQVEVEKGTGGLMVMDKIQKKRNRRVSLMLRTTCPLPLPPTYIYVQFPVGYTLAFSGYWGEDGKEQSTQLKRRALQNERYYAFSPSALSPSCTDILGMSQSAKTNDPYFLGGGEQVEKMTTGST